MYARTMLERRTRDVARRRAAKVLAPGASTRASLPLSAVESSSGVTARDKVRHSSVILANCRPPSLPSQHAIAVVVNRAYAARPLEMLRGLDEHSTYVSICGREVRRQGSLPPALPRRTHLAHSAWLRCAAGVAFDALCLAPSKFPSWPWPSWIGRTPMD